jgi:hypothetical protein
MQDVSSNSVAADYSMSYRQHAAVLTRGFEGVEEITQQACPRKTGAA